MKNPLIEHLEAAMILAQYEEMPLVSYLAGLAKVAALEGKPVQAPVKKGPKTVAA